MADQGVDGSPSAADLDALRCLVVAEQDRTAAQLVALVRTFDELVAAADLEPPDEHDPDGTTAYERAQVASLIDSARTNLADLARALARLDADTATTCASCGRPITMERLLAVPTARKCIDCAH
ncbi:MAG: TraR/DksA family transcriptional regulator [Acidimicrobiales bacterium]